MKRSLIIVILLAMGFVLWSANPPETILAKYSQGTLTMEYFNERLSKIPAMYQSRYNSYEGKVKLLNDLVTEEVFYLEAVEMGLKDDPEIDEKAENQLLSTYYTEYKKQLAKENIAITDDELKDYFKQNLDEYPGITFDEARTMVEKKYRSIKEKEFLEEYSNKLHQKFAITIHEELLDSLKMNDQSTIDPIAAEKYITSNNPELEQTIADLKDFYDGLPVNNRRSLLGKESLINSIKEMTKMQLFALEAKENGFSDNKVILETRQMIIRQLMLRETYNRLITNQIDVNENTIRDYYEENLEKFSTKPYRKIQVFGFKDEAAAQEAKEKVKNALAEDDSLLLSEVLESSNFEFSNGEISYIYQNGIIPKFGKDQVWNEKVWEDNYGETDPRKLSEIFLSSEDYYVFFRILEDNVPVATPFEEAKGKIENEMRRDKSNELFKEQEELLRNKYQVVLFEDNLVEKLSAEEYFTNAENAQKKRRYKDAIYYYDQICEFYKNGKDDYKAMFMKGFIYAEDLKNKDKAINIFEELIEKYPEADLHESARFMIDDLQGKTEIFKNME